jgi:hypothetical protein
LVKTAKAAYPGWGASCSGVVGRKMLAATAEEVVDMRRRDIERFGTKRRGIA